MLKEANGFGETIEEAYEEAKNNLCLLLAGVKFNEDDIQLDVVSLPKKKTLGLFGGNKAEVRAFIELPDQKKKTANKVQKTEKTKAEKPKKENKVNNKKEPEIKEDKVVLTAETDKTVALNELADDSRALMCFEQYHQNNCKHKRKRKMALPFIFRVTVLAWLSAEGAKPLTLYSILQAFLLTL